MRTPVTEPRKVEGPSLFSPIPHEKWRTVRATVTALLLIAMLRGRTVAGPAGGGVDPSLPHDPNATDRDTPWLDQAPTAPGVLTARSEPAGPSGPDHKLAASLTLGGIYAAFTTWTYFAWYRQHKPLSGPAAPCRAGPGTAAAPARWRGA